MAKVQNWEALRDTVVGEIMTFFEQETTDSNALAKVKIATSVLSSYTRHEATESARLTTHVLIARQLATNSEEFAQYLKISMPKSKALPTSNTGNVPPSAS